jgi:sorbitol-6-phosphate 2-dehydrogenase
MSYQDLKGKTVIVTGGALGIGREIVASFAKNSSNVVVADISEKGQEVVNELNGDEQRHLFVQTDVADASSVENMVKLTMSTYGRINVLVDNAGINIPRLLVDPKETHGRYELGEEEFDKMVAVNQKGPYLCTQGVVREMIKRKTRG